MINRQIQQIGFCLYCTAYWYCLLAWGGTWVVGWGERGNFMYFKYNFSLDTAKRMLKPFVHTSFSIRVFWLR